MRAKDIMTTGVITVTPETTIDAIAGLLLDRRISAVPVVDPDGTLVGIVSEGDLIRRVETGTEPRPSWWLELLRTTEDRALDYVRSHGRRAAEIMSTSLITVTEETELREIARLLEDNRIKRVPVVRDGRLVGIVSRADLLRGLITARPAASPAGNDAQIRTEALKRVHDTGISDTLLNVTIADGTAHLWGSVTTEAERLAARVAVENTPGVGELVDHLRVLRP
jgi:CBS domain-containing protein